MVETMTKEKDNALFPKNEFLEDMTNRNLISQKTAEAYGRILRMVTKNEEDFNKDVSKFTFKQLEEVMYDFQANNRNTIESYGRVISSYLNWCVEKGKIKKNHLATFNPDSFIKYLTNSETYITEKQLRRWEDSCANYQDAIIIRLLFLGAGGKEMSEIRNLKQEHIDWDKGEIKLIETVKEDEDGNLIKYNERTIYLKDEYKEHTLELLRGAIKQRTYLKNNGEVKDGATSRSVGYLDLVQNDYVVRPSVTRTETVSTRLDKYVIYRRMDMLAGIFGLEKLTAKYIQRCGMIYLANELVGDAEELTLDDFKMVAKRYNLSTYHNLKGFLTMTNIRKTYKK